MYLKRASDLKKFILNSYPKLSKDKMDVLKIGSRIYLVIVTPDNKLAREKLFVGALETVNDLVPMKRLLESNIQLAMSKHGYM